MSNTWWYLTKESTSFYNPSPTREQYGRKVYFKEGEYCRELFVGRVREQLVYIEDIPDCWVDVSGIRWAGREPSQSHEPICTTSMVVLWVESIFNLLTNLLSYTWYPKLLAGGTFLGRYSRLKPPYFSDSLRPDAPPMEVTPLRLPGVPYPTSIYFNHDPNLEESRKLSPEWAHHLGNVESNLGGIRGIPAEWLDSKPIISCLLFFARFAESLIEEGIDIAKVVWKPHAKFISYLAGDERVHYNTCQLKRRFANTLARFAAPLFVSSSNGSAGLWFIFGLLIEGAVDQEAAERAKELLLLEGNFCDGMNTWLRRLLHQGLLSGKQQEFAEILNATYLDTLMYPRKYIY